MLVCRSRLLLRTALAALVAAACSKPEPMAPEPPVETPPPREPPSVLPLAPVPPILVQAVGLESPAAAIHDPAADHYLVANIAGGALERDGNGFISRLSPEGAVLQLKWIEGKAGALDLHAPKGMAIAGDQLLVADIDVVRRFDRQSGKPLGEIPVPGAASLKDVAVAPDGVLYVSDNGLRKIQGLADPQKSGGDAIYAVDAQGVATVLISGPELGQPGGLFADQDGVWVANALGELYRVSRAGKREAVATLPGGGLQGLVRTASGRFIVSSAQDSSVYAGKASAAAVNSFDPLITELESPADLGYDTERRQLIVPLLGRHAIYMQQVTGD